MLFYGLWFGETKPSIQTFCQPLYKELKMLECQGINLDLCGKCQVVKAFLISLTADLPAKSTIMNMVPFNASYSCVKCLQKGHNFRTQNRGNVHSFTYQTVDPCGPERTKEGILKDSLEASEKGFVVHGIKGPSFLMNVSSFDCVRGVGIDYMHCILLGITK